MAAAEEFRRALTTGADGPTLTLERHYPVGPTDLWDALTDPARLARWFGTFRNPYPAAEGDAFTVDLGGGEDDIGRGTVQECRPPVRLRYGWQWQGEDVSQVSVELTAADGGTDLRLVHSRVQADHVVGYGGGWEETLLKLDDEVSGESRYGPGSGEHEAEANACWAELQQRGGG